MTRPADHDCGSCSRPSRRRFLTQVSGAATATAICQQWASALGATEASPVAATSAAASTASYPLPTKDGVSIDNKEQVILVRWQQKVFAFPLACPHENTALKWRQGDMRFQCPKHESKYKPDGTFLSGRATRNMDRFAISRSGDSVVVDLDKFYQSDSQASDWAAAVLAV
jgi:Rieske Fe-S protein